MSFTSSSSYDDSGPIVSHSSSKVNCNICNVFIPNAHFNIQQHLDGYQHRDKALKKLMSENGIFYEDGESYCKPCKEYFCYHVDDIEDHVYGDEHSKWMSQMEDLIDSQFIDMDEYLSQSKVYLVQCEICNCSISTSYECIDQHIRGLGHTDARANKLMPLNGIFEVDGNKDVWCKVCNEYINNTYEDIFDHIESDDEHVRIINELEYLIEDEGISIDGYLSDLYESKAHCFTCKNKIPCNPHNLEEHINGSGHSYASA